MKFFLLLLFFCSGAFAQSRPFILGETVEVTSAILCEKRTLNIYLPEGYNQKDTIRYPVIYLLDGSADEDFIHIAGLVQFNSFEWVNRVPKSIVVGIATVDRRRDFTFPTTIDTDLQSFPTSGNSDKFISFLKHELLPFVEAKYNTGETRTIIGQSLGGLVATEILFKNPNLFNKYIIVSPSLWWDNGSLLDRTPVKINNLTEIYIGVGKEGLTPTSKPRVMEVDANLLAEKIRESAGKTANVIFDYLPEENHATILHQAVSNAFKLFFRIGK